MVFLSYAKNIQSQLLGLWLFFFTHSIELPLLSTTHSLPGETHTLYFHNNRNLYACNITGLFISLFDILGMCVASFSLCLPIQPRRSKHLTLAHYQSLLQLIESDKTYNCCYLSSPFSFTAEGRIRKFYIL